MKLEKVIVTGVNKNSISLGNHENIDWFKEQDQIFDTVPCIL